ncbi:LacI family transcriptional regulator [Clostridium bowmanii]|uniref:LacI family DNA-binding transcriptional regulator n=1 Tax=Clostridium bowmanii TaxID=132925 RepID=UPI001C0AAEA6|nr:LacI family DNA-binding transcriptional regulator [Clostridium bowmanii]MBU3190363.1 LacI family transcriptional regulator [Clostridium bowmanii]MCA1074875.1 LacI family transcriptional regulator [Clostridium bowmanii]
MSNKITISDIAFALDISAISVSRALSGKIGVGEELREKIMLKAKEMGYIKSIKKNSYKILVLHQRPLTHDNSNFAYMIQGMQRALQNMDISYHTEFVDKNNQDEMKPPLKLLKENSFNGIIFIGRFNDDYIGFLKQKIRNHIFYTGYSPSCDVDSVWFNFNNGGYKQCEYLIKKGHVDIGFLGRRSILFRNKEKVLGITSALEDYKIPIRSEFFTYIEEDFEENFEISVMKLLIAKDRPSAIICQGDFIAVKLINLLYKKGIKVPEDISIISSGNTEMASLTLPTLTTLDLNIEYSCEIAVELLLKRINNPEKPCESITINSNLIIRESVKCLF